ncbi:MAG: YfiR family protein [Bacteroidales bacterium]|nr:YfiR family protein [Bacteroidales bacterium]
MKKIYVAMLAIIILFTTSNYAQIAKYESGFIYQFTKYIQWPSDYRSGDFVIGVYGTSDITKYLNVLASARKVVSQTIVVKKYNSSSEIGKCHIVVIANDKSGDLSAVKTAIGGNSTLIVCEKPGMAKEGAHISFVPQGERVAYEVNESNFKKYNLSVDPQLVKMAVKSY